jgi:hypothetical protein
MSNLSKSERKLKTDINYMCQQIKASTFLPKALHTFLKAVSKRKFNT